ncbi:hypothetical protein SHKM778_92590 [Streptomyces sp. KM77-8]|uniref:MFS transporter n=1 Tax=Streptomyces haneummycinicus TaxID=3074435 RepID=A0AAT9HZ73_9ACTN
MIAGLFTGIVAARVLGGLAGQAFGWRWVFAGAALLTLALGVATALVLPSERRHRDGPLFGGIAALPGLLRSSPGLWRASVRQAGMFGAWSALWTSLALLLTGPAYDLSTATAGLFGLFGLAASAVAPLAGGLVDRFGAAMVVRGRICSRPGPCRCSGWADRSSGRCSSPRSRSTRPWSPPTSPTRPSP